MSSTPPQSDTVVEVSIRMSLLVDDLVHATHEQAPIGEFYKAKDTLLREIARLEGIVTTCAKYPIVGARYARDYVTKNNHA